MAPAVTRHVLVTAGAFRPGRTGAKAPGRAWGKTWNPASICAIAAAGGTACPPAARSGTACVTVMVPLKVCFAVNTSPGRAPDHRKRELTSTQA